VGHRDHPLGQEPRERTRNIAGHYRGTIAIHAGLTEDLAAYDDELIVQRLAEYDDGWLLQEHLETGVILGVADLVSVHHDSDHGPPRCSPWAERGTWHLQLANPRPLAQPVPCRGALGLWTLPPEVRDAVLEQLVEAFDG
jgi:hypothetical protein